MDHITFFIETTSGKVLLTVAAVVVLLAVKKYFLVLSILTSKLLRKNLGSYTR